MALILWTATSASVINALTDEQGDAPIIAVAALLPACPTPSAYGEIILSPFYAEDRTFFFRYSQKAFLWRTTDDGQRWERIYVAPQPSGRVTQVSIPPILSNANLWIYVVYAYDFPDPRTVKEIVRSTDGGITWQPRTSCDPNCISALATNRPETIFADRSEPYYVFEPGKGVLRSDDGGLTWEIQWDQASVWGIHVSPAFADDQTIFVRTWSWHEPPASWLIASTDGGSTWLSRDHGLDGSPVEQMEFSPGFNQDQTLFAVIGDSLFRSQDAGLTWQAIFSVNHSVITDMVISPHYLTDRSLFLATHEEVMVSYNAGHDWSILIRERFAYHLTIGAGVNLASSSVAPLRTLAGPRLSRRLYVPLAGKIGLRPLPLTLFLSATPPGRLTMYYRSDDGGLTWNCLSLPPVDN
jgi:hypothetical protein